MSWFVRVVAVSLALLTGLVPAVADERSTAMERILSAAIDYGAVSGPGVAEQLRRACGDDPLCVAQRLVAAGEGRARLVQVSHPDSDTIRWVTTEPSVTESRWLSNGARLIVLDGFGRKVVPELQAALKGHKAGERVVLDLRGNAGGDLGRMLDVAALFLPGMQNALYIVDDQDRKALHVASGKTLFRGGLTLLVGPGTASSGEVLAALLQRHLGARMLGESTAGKDYLYRVVPVDQEWRLLLRAESIVVPGATIAGGLLPAAEIPEALAAEVGE